MQKNIEVRFFSRKWALNEPYIFAKQRPFFLVWIFILFLLCVDSIIYASDNSDDGDHLRWSVGNTVRVYTHSGHVSHLSWGVGGMCKQIIRQCSSQDYDCKFCFASNVRSLVLPMQVQCTDSTLTISKVGTKNIFHLKFTPTEKGVLFQRETAFGPSKTSTGGVLSGLFLPMALVLEETTLSAYLMGENRVLRHVLSIEPVLTLEDEGLMLKVYPLKDEQFAFRGHRYRSVKKPKHFDEYFTDIQALLKLESDRVLFDYRALDVTKMARTMNVQLSCNNPQGFTAFYSVANCYVQVALCDIEMNYIGVPFPLMDIYFSRKQPYTSKLDHFQICHQIQCVDDYALVTLLVKKMASSANENDQSQLLGRWSMLKSDMIANAYVRPVLHVKHVSLVYEISAKVKIVLNVPDLRFLERKIPLHIGELETALVLYNQKDPRALELDFKFAHNFYQTTGMTYTLRGLIPAPDIYIPKRERVQDVFQPRRLLCNGQPNLISRMIINSHNSVYTLLLYYQICAQELGGKVMSVWLRHERTGQDFNSLLCIDVSERDIQQHTLKGGMVIQKDGKQYFHCVLPNSTLDFCWLKDWNFLSAVANSGSYSQGLCAFLVDNNKVFYHPPLTLPVSKECFYRSDVLFKNHKEKQVVRHSFFHDGGVDWNRWEVFVADPNHENLLCIMENVQTQERWCWQLTVKNKKPCDIVRYQHTKQSSSGKDIRQGLIRWRHNQLRHYVNGEKTVDVIPLGDEVSALPKCDGAWEGCGWQFLLPSGEIVVFTPRLPYGYTSDVNELYLWSVQRQCVIFTFDGAADGNGQETKSMDF